MRSIAAAVVIALACVAGSAGAQDLPSGDRMAAEGRGAGLDARRGCPAKGTLGVSILVDRVGKPGGATTRVRHSRSGAVDNCAEGGPNFGYDLTARAARMACP